MASTPADRCMAWPESPMSAGNADDAPDAVPDQMDHDRMPLIDAATAERLVAGERAGHEPLADLLATAAGPGTPEELVGEEQALVAFRRAQGTPATEVPKRSRALARLLTVKVAAFALAGTATGVALATVTGALP